MRHFQSLFLLFLTSVLLVGSAHVGSMDAATGSSRRCPPMKSGTACFQIYEPVVCNGCRYGNLCQAQAAGFKAKACVPEGTRSGATCPPPKRDIVCTKEYKPVTCNGCRYSNSCEASAAGFASNRCIPAAVQEAKKPCPAPSPDKTCAEDFTPVLCDGCEYANACFAGAAGFTKEQCVPAPAQD